MNAFLWNLILALVWTAATGEFSLPNLLIGFALGYVILFFVRKDLGTNWYVARVPRAIGFLFFVGLGILGRHAGPLRTKNETRRWHLFIRPLGVRVNELSALHFWILAPSGISGRKTSTSYVFPRMTSST